MHLSTQKACGAAARLFRRVYRMPIGPDLMLSSISPQSIFGTAALPGKSLVGPRLTLPISLMVLTTSEKNASFMVLACDKNTTARFGGPLFMRGNL